MAGEVPIRVDDEQGNPTQGSEIHSTLLLILTELRALRMALQYISDADFGFIEAAQEYDPEEVNN